MLALTKTEAPSVLQVRTDDVSPASLASRTIDLSRRFENELQSGALIVVDEKRYRAVRAQHCALAGSVLGRSGGGVVSIRLVAGRVG